VTLNGNGRIRHRLKQRIELIGVNVQVFVFHCFKGKPLKAERSDQLSAAADHDAGSNDAGKRQKPLQRHFFSGKVQRIKHEILFSFEQLRALIEVTPQPDQKSRFPLAFTSVLSQTASCLKI